MQLNLALAQIATKLGDVQFNLEKHLDFIKQARAQKADLILFPELSLTGYYAPGPGIDRGPPAFGG